MALQFTQPSAYFLQTIDLPPITEYTMMAWWRQTSGITVPSVNNSIFYRNNGSGDTQWAGLYIKDFGGTDTFFIDNTASSATGSAVTANQWYHLTFTVSLAGVYTFWLDGTSNATFTDTSTITNTRLYVGDNSFSIGDQVYELAAFKMWSQVLSRPEIWDEMYEEAPVRRDALEMWLPLQNKWEVVERSRRNRQFTTAGTIVGASAHPPISQVRRQKRPVYLRAAAAAAAGQPTQRRWQTVPHMGGVKRFAQVGSW